MKCWRVTSLLRKTSSRQQADTNIEMSAMTKNMPRAATEAQNHFILVRLRKNTGKAE